MASSVNSIPAASSSSSNPANMSQNTGARPSLKSTAHSKVSDGARRQSGSPMEGAQRYAVSHSCAIAFLSCLIVCISYQFIPVHIKECPRDICLINYSRFSFSHLRSLPKPIQAPTSSLYSPAFQWSSAAQHMAPNYNPSQTYSVKLASRKLAEGS